MMCDELIKRLRETSVNFGELDHVSVMMIEAADAIEELSRDLDYMNDANIALYGALPQWIPVTDRMPDDGAEVLAFSISGFAYVDWWIDGKWKVNSMVDGKFVTHWMPLPEAPKDGEA